MNCKHIKIEGNTTKYFYCNVKGKAINEYDCKNCPLKIENDNDVINQLFGKIFERGVAD